MSCSHCPMSVDHITAILRVLALNSSMKDLTIAFHNLCVHGEIFEDTGEDLDDKELEAWFDCLDNLTEILKSK